MSEKENKYYCPKCGLKYFGNPIRCNGTYTNGVCNTPLKKIEKVPEDCPLIASGLVNQPVSCPCYNYQNCNSPNKRLK